MKEIKLPARYIIRASLPIHFDNKESEQVGNIKAAHISTFKVNKEEYDIVQKNGAQVISSTIYIESLIEDILSIYLFEDKKENNSKRSFFDNEILKSDNLSFSAKKELLQKLLNSLVFLKGKEKDLLQKNFKNILNIRNAFAHGKLVDDTNKDWQIQYYSGSKKNISLDDIYWQELEDCFNQTDTLLKDIKDKLVKKFTPSS
ncbi:MAG: hypothetical protein P9X22_00595 [Candidatus Zapsychrus exili]|nr:hypothetical protein [Candidatus Zapsychrus exili]